MKRKKLTCCRGGAGEQGRPGGEGGAELGVGRGGAGWRRRVAGPGREGRAELGRAGGAGWSGRWSWVGPVEQGGGAGWRGG